MKTYTFKQFGKEITIETGLYRGIEHYKGISIRFDEKNKKWIARDGRKILTKAIDKITLLSEIHSIILNKELSNRF